MRIHPETFTTGDLVQASGMYSVTHPAHRLFAEAALFRGEAFPKCALCSARVIFNVIREFPGLDFVENLSLRIPLYELPVIEDEPAIIPAA